MSFIQTTLSEIISEFQAMKRCRFFIPKDETIIFRQLQRNSEKFHMLYTIIPLVLVSIFAFYHGESYGFVYLFSSLILIYLTKSVELFKNFMKNNNIPNWIVVFFGSIPMFLVLIFTKGNAMKFMFMSNTVSGIIGCHAVAAKDVRDIIRENQMNQEYQEYGTVEMKKKEEDSVKEEANRVKSKLE